MSRTYKTIRWNALTRKARSHGYEEAEDYIAHAHGYRNMLRGRRWKCDCLCCLGNRLHQRHLSDESSKQAIREWGEERMCNMMQPTELRVGQVWRKPDGSTMRITNRVGSRYGMTWPEDPYLDLNAISLWDADEYRADGTYFGWFFVTLEMLQRQGYRYDGIQDQLPINNTRRK